MAETTKEKNRMITRVISLVLSIVMLLSITVGIDLSAYAAGNSFSTATAIELNKVYNGSITDSNTTDFYKFTLESSGKIKLALNVICNSYASLKYYIYNSDWEIMKYDYSGANTPGEQASLSKEVDLTKGTYYFALEGSSAYTGEYSFKITFTTASESFTETNGGTNNSIEKANAIALNKTYNGQIAENDSADYYKFTVNAQGTINLIITGDGVINCVGCYIYDSYGKTVWSEPNARVNGQTLLDKEIDLAKGTYYFAVLQRSGFGIEGTGNYSFTVKCVHNWDSGKVTKEATGTATGVKTYTCKNCGATKTETILATPKISSVGNTATGVKIAWGKVAGASKYRVFYKTGNGSWTKLADTTSTSYTWTKAKSGTKYTFTVRCINSGATAYTSAYDTTGKSITYVAAPKLSAVANTTTGVKISWGKVAGAAKYRVFYKTGNGSWTKLADTTSTSYTWTKAKSGTKYTFTVRCINSGATAYTSAYDTTGKSVTYVAAPKLSSVANTATGVKITWGKVTGAAKYRVFYKANGESTWHKAGDTTSTSYTWTGAKSGTKYTFTVRCINSGATAYTSAYDTTGKSITYVAAPKISSLSKSSSAVTIKWGKVTGAVNYKVFRKTANGSWTSIGTTTGTSFVDKTAKKGTKYTYTVRCISKDGKNYTSAYDNTGKSITR